MTTVLDKHLPLEAAAEIISSLGLNSAQTRRANRTMQRIVYRAWTRRSRTKQAVAFEEFADAVPECHWSLMFEVCGLVLLGRDAEACTLIAAARHLEAARSAGGAT
ncbi:hypothetical protein OG453_07020 [Streptomyces sp. NBC_01381]|uniref:hypothetical protein n=1 Tax=Streptomyces sp. NBC_01381 TaxID=2903845 RepID=UPI0022564935|nr:hypothetical protein [Streptomyces sp. NBC_01381]MCX4666419.1 hypothetical protein [Streptomyces sp. NBC_01381]